MQNIYIGSLPPPLGGITVYLYRLSKVEKDALFIDERDIQDGFKFKLWLIKQIFSLKKKNYIYNNPSLRMRLFFYLLSCISIHDFSLIIHGISLIDQYQKSNRFIKFLIRSMLKKANFIQVVNPEYKKFINSLNIKTKKIIIKSGFLPPPLEEEEKILNTYNKKLIEFLKIKKPIIIANSFAIVFFNNVDLYGLDISIELTKKLKKDYPNIGFLFAIANEKINRWYLEKMKKRIIELEIELNFYFITGQKEIWPLFKKADLMIRPTYVDGYGISISEALYFNCPAIASNVCKRPEGTIIFKNREIEDLYNKCKDILKEKII